MKIVLTCHTRHFRNVWWYQSNFRLGILNKPRFRKFYVTCLCDWSGKLERSLPRSPLPRPRAKTWQEKAPADWALFSPHRASHTKLFLSSKQHLTLRILSCLPRFSLGPKFSMILAEWFYFLQKLRLKLCCLPSWRPKDEPLGSWIVPNLCSPS